MPLRMRRNEKNVASMKSEIIFWFNESEKRATTAKTKCI